MEAETEKRGGACNWTIRDGVWSVCLWAALTVIIAHIPDLTARMVSTICRWPWPKAGVFHQNTRVFWALSAGLAGLIVTWFAVKSLPTTLRELGVRKPEASLKWTVGFSAALAVVYVGGGAGLRLAPEIVGRLFPWWEIQTYGYWATVVAFCISAPLGEEVVFRGMLYPALRDKLGVWKAIVVSAAAFALMHNFLTMRLFLPVTQFVGGLIFAYSYEKSKSLLLPILYHACGNALLFVGFHLAAACCLIG